MQIKRIIEKASRLGISIDTTLTDEENINAIASSLNMSTDNLNALENKIDNELAVDNYRDIPDYISDEPQSFGEKEYNAARGENGVYDKNYYSKKGEELEKKVSDAKAEKAKDVKTNKDGETVGKNKFDKARDNVNLLKTKGDQLQNRINKTKAGIYNATHPEEAIENKANEIKENIKSNVKAKAKEETKKAAKKSRDAILAYIKKNPYVLLIVGAVIILLIIIIIIAGGGNFGGGKYEYFPGICDNVQINGEIISLDEYVAGNVAHELSPRATTTDYPETLKMEAVAARTFAVQHGIKNGEGASCYYDLDAEVQKVGFEPESVTAMHREAVEATTGLIITLDGKPRTHFDSCALYNAHQAKYYAEANNKISHPETFDETKLYILYGLRTIDLNTDNVHFQEVEREKLLGIKSSTIKECVDDVEEFHHGLGYGISEQGSRYLEQYEGYTWEQIIDFYYDHQEKIVTIYENKEIESGSDSYWFPVGGSELTTINGLDFATGEPVTTRLTAYFGGNDSVHKGLGSGHGAIDIGAPQGSYVIATKDGTVIYPRQGDRTDYPNQYIKPDENGKYNCKGLHGNYVEIDHGDGVVTQYQHLLAGTITVKSGDKVHQGQVIGKVGSSGCSTGPHLHFAIRINGKAVDPLDYVSTTDTRPGSHKTSFSGNYPIDRYYSLYNNAIYLRNKSYATLLQSNGQSVKSFEEFLYSQIKKAGIGTRDGAVAAAMTLIGANAEMGYKISYQWGGKYAHIGVNKNWGNKLSDDKITSMCNSYATVYPDKIANCYENYKWSGFDCSGFVTWAVINGIQREISQINTSTGGSIAIDPDIAVCKKGGVLLNNGHIVLVVKVDEAKKEYTIAQSTGSSGVGLAIFPFDKKGWKSDYVCKNLEEIYGD